MLARSPRRPGLSGVLALSAALALVLALPQPSPASELRLWPLVNYRSNPETGAFQLDLLGPLFSYQRSPGRRAWALRPIMSRVHGREGSGFDLVYPLLSYERGFQRTRLSLAGLIVNDRRAVAGNQNGPDSFHRFQIRPLIYYGKRGNDRARLSVFPLYVDIRGSFGIDRIRSVMFPLYVEATRDQETRRWLPFPFVSMVSGPGARGFRLWPVAGFTDVAGRERSRYLAWPLYVSRDTWDDAGRLTSQRLYYPLHARLDSPDLRHRAYLNPLFIPFFSTTEDKRAGLRTTAALWPLFMTQHDLETGEMLTARLFPLWQTARREGRQRSFYAWPLVRWRSWDQPGYRRHSLTGLLMLARDIEERIGPAEGDGVHIRRTRTVFGVMREVESDGVRRGQAPALLDALLPANPHLDTLYSPLWRVLAWNRPSAEAPTEWNLLWGLAGYGAEGWQGPLAFDL